MTSIKMEPAIGIYLSTEYSCVGVWHDGRVEIIPNDQGNMTTPSCVAFTPDSRLIGEAAEIQANKNPTNTIFDMNCLIGRCYSDPIVQSNRKLWPFNVIEGAEDKPTIVVQYRGEEKQFYPEELSSMILAKMKKIAENFLDCIVRDALVIVRAYFNDSQRRAMRNAGLIAGLNVMYIMDESVMMNYCTPQMVALREIGNANQERVDLQRELSEAQILTEKLMSERDKAKRLTQQLMFERDVATKLSEVAQKQLMCERNDARKLSEAIKKHTKQLMSERDDARKLSEVAQKQLMSERDDSRKHSEATKKHTKLLRSKRDDTRKLLEAAQKQLISERDDARKLSEMTQKQLMCERDDARKLLEATHKQTKQLLSERDDARKHSEAAQKLTEQLMSERDDARKHSEAAQKLTEQLMSERDDAKKYSEAAQKLTEQLMSERDDARKHSEAAQKLTEQLMSERDEAKKHAEAAQKLTKQLMSERDDAKKHSEAAQKLIEELISERDYAIKQVEELRWLTEQQALGRKCVRCFIGYSHSELQNATNNFHESFKLGEGGFGKVYKGFLHDSTTIAIKILNQGSSQGAKEFHQEVEVLSKLQHPNLVKLIGACAEIHALIYEYLPNGSLEDRLRCKNNTLPLSWQARVRIAFEICSALSFLHCSKPHGIVHGDLKPDNVLLDLNNVSKLSDFGLCRQLNQTTNASQPFHITDCLKGTFGYIDPEYFTTGKMTPQNDVYSLGIMLLQLVTCKDPRGIRQSVEEAHRKGTLKALIDASAGPWPFKKAEKMISLGLRCSDIMSINRPDLSTVVLKEMKSMADVASASQSSSWIASLFRR